MTLRLQTFALDLRAKKRHNVVIKNNPVAKLKLENVVFVMHCNVVSSDFFFPNLHSKVSNLIFKTILMMIMTKSSNLICKARGNQIFRPKNTILLLLGPFA